MAPQTNFVKNNHYFVEKRPVTRAEGHCVLCVGVRTVVIVDYQPPADIDEHRRALLLSDGLIQLFHYEFDFSVTPSSTDLLLERFREVLATEPLEGMTRPLSMTGRGHWGGIMVEDPFRERKWRSLEDVPYLARRTEATSSIRVLGDYLQYRSRVLSSYRPGVYAALGLQDELLNILEVHGCPQMRTIRHDTVWRSEEPSCPLVLPEKAAVCERCQRHAA